jgi:beta-galactosidase GanA
MCDAEESLVNVVAGHSAIEGKSVCSVAKVGEGRVIMLGTLPSGHAMRRLAGYACELAEVALPEVEGRVMVVNRDDKGLMLVEYNAKPAAITLDKPVRDLITGKEYEGRIELKPYDVMVLEYIG